MALAAFGAVIGAGGVIGLTAPAQAASNVPDGCTHPSGAALVTCTFGYTGADQTFAVPIGISFDRADRVGWARSFWTAWGRSGTATDREAGEASCRARCRSHRDNH